MGKLKKLIGVAVVSGIVYKAVKKMKSSGACGEIEVEDVVAENAG